MFTVPLYFVTTWRDSDDPDDPFGAGHVITKWTPRFDFEEDARAHATGLTTDGVDDVRIHRIDVPVRISTATRVN